MAIDIWQHLFFTSQQLNPIFFHAHQIIRSIFTAKFHMLLEDEGRICSNVHDFTIERIRIDMSLLLNDYPPAFITKHISRFFDQYNAQSVLKRLYEQ
jgi:hypothetical protein